MTPQVLRRFIFLMAVTIVVGGVIWIFVGDKFNRDPGDYHTDTGNNRLEDGLYDEAMAEFDKALAEAPKHRGALMGRALVHIQTERYEDAIAELGVLIGILEEVLRQGSDDPTDRGLLAAAYGNRGIVYDRMGAYRQAFDDYIAALRTDAGAVEGPDLFQKLLYSEGRTSSVEKRARYLYEQFQVPEEERVMRIPELDEQQWMYKP